MVKIPGLDDLKKMGSGLIESARSVNVSEVVDKVKSGIESVGKKAPLDVPNGREGVRALFADLSKTLQELQSAQSASLSATKKLETELAQLAKLWEAELATLPPKEDKRGDNS